MPLDKVEGFVKGRVLLSGDGTPRVGQGTVEDDTLWSSRVDQMQWLGPGLPSSIDSIDPKNGLIMILIANIQPPPRGECGKRAVCVFHHFHPFSSVGNVGNAWFAFSIISIASGALWDARALIQCCGLAFADQGHPRAALDEDGFLDLLLRA